ncbi:MAG: hypothetical protein LKF88_03925 [Microbacteriaceae bacterium]|jgi:predicted membrane-bound dolichyl-phosphate-mannose-protein mannosyltransferase|nr:hypothetical protein [Microbacteriaceae bacterium]MCI1207221.1 hypothetical protein [Microbacteriaceae bacterium]
MLTLLIVLLVAWIVVAILGLTLKGLIWLFWIGLILFAITAILGWIKRAGSGR